jgi:2-polyprenyl-3-methyl-5-hydroxy-6-metoxy-1,4-benzoquinol methylase
LSLEKYKQVVHKDFIQDIDFINKTIKELNLNKSSRILDIGTGMGAMAILLAINDFDVLTGEPKFEPERDGGEHYEHHHGQYYEFHHEECFEGNWADWRETAKEIGVEHKIKYQHFNAENLPFTDESYDGVFMYDALQHIQNREQALHECL